MITIMVDPNINKLETILGYSFRDQHLLLSAITHRSFVNECRSPGCSDNERLEFLGDAVLDLIMSEYLMTTFPESEEGDLSQIRADLRANHSLAKVARTIGLDQFLRLGKGVVASGGNVQSSLLADALEAIFGAVFTDGGYGAAKQMILPLFIPLLKTPPADETIDYKSRLQEYLQAQRRSLPIYRMTDTAGLPNEPVHQVEVVIAGRVQGTGQGRTKKAAEQNAAKVALAALEKK